MQTALSKMTTLWASDPLRALHMAAKWADLGTHKDAITRGSAAAKHPDFYRQLKRDPVVCVNAGLAALAERYKLQPCQPLETL